MDKKRSFVWTFVSGVTASIFMVTPLVSASTTVNTINADSVDPTIPEVHIGSDGLVAVKGMKVWQRAGNSLFTRTTWDKSFIRWTIKTTADTVVSKRYGDKMTVYDISEGDYLSVDGYIEGGSSLSIIATKITDWSNYQALTSFSGKISSLGANNASFNLVNDLYGDIQVKLSSTTIIIRNRREITPKYLKVGDKIISIVGTFDHKSKKLDAEKISVHIDSNIFTPKNYQGKLVSLASHNLPTTLSVNIADVTYKVNLGQDAIILNNQRNPATLDRFLEGDIIRLYGFIRQDNDDLDTINASILRNTSF